MKFTVLERIVLMGVLPQESNYVTHKIVSNLKADLSFSEKEIKDFKIVQIADKEGKLTVNWDNKREKVKEVEIGEAMRQIIEISLKKLDEQGKINDQNASLYEKFVLTIKT